MSRSKHQRHPTSHSKHNRMSWPYRKRKMRPYGYKPAKNGYPNEHYYRSMHEEMCHDDNSRAYQKQQDKKEIENQLNELNYD